MRHLSYGRIILNSSKPQVSFSNGEQESGLICLSGNGVVKTAGNEYELGQFDAIYIPAIPPSKSRRKPPSISRSFRRR